MQTLLKIQRISNMKASYRFRLGAIIASDTRKGQVIRPTIAKVNKVPSSSFAERLKALVNSDNNTGQVWGS